MLSLRRPALFRYFSAALLTLLAGCASLAPAKTPPQLKHTPGNFVVVSEGHFDAGRFRVDYPSSWRLVKESAATADLLTITLFAPDGSAVAIAELARDSASSENTVRLANGVMIQATVDAADQPSPTFAAQAERILRSIRN